MRSFYSYSKSQFEHWHNVDLIEQRSIWWYKKGKDTITKHIRAGVCGLGFVFLISILYRKPIQTTRLSDFPICFDRVTYKAHSVRTSCSLQSGESMLKQTCLPVTYRCNTFKYKYKYTMARSMLLKNMSSLHLISFNITFQYIYKYNMAKSMLQDKYVYIATNLFL